MMLVPFHCKNWLVEGGVPESGVGVAPKCSWVTWSEVLTSTPAATSCIWLPPFPDIIQRWLEDEAQRKSKLSAESVHAPSGSLMASPPQESTSFTSLVMHRLAVLAVLRQQMASPEARRRIPVVAGVDEPEMKVPMKGEPLEEPPGGPGTWSTENNTSARAQLAPAFRMHGTN